MTGLAVLCGGSAHSLEDPAYTTYQQSIARMSQPDESFATVTVIPGPMPVRPIPATSKTCSQRCSTRCSVGCTTTRGCSSQCKVQTDGCGGSSDYGGATTLPPSWSESERVDINSATSEELMALPGVGPATAQRIIDRRPYSSEEQLVSRRILTRTAYNKLKAWIIARPLDINSATSEELMALPGVGPVTAQRIIDRRPYSSRDELLSRGIVTRTTYDKIRFYVVARTAR